MPNSTPKIGPAIQKERKLRKLTLEQLSVLSGVSKSMLSQIERSETNPTFAVVWSLTEALDLNFSSLVSGASSALEVDQIEVTPKVHTPQIISQDARCRLKILSSPRLAGRTEWYGVEIDPGGRLESAPHRAGTLEHFTAFTDGFELTCGRNKIKINEGETARYHADNSHCIANTSNTLAIGLLVVLYK